MSTRGADGSKKTFCDVVLEGLASDGGLYVLNDNPASFSHDQLLRLVPLSYPERALRILEQWINSSHLSPSVLRKMIENAYNIDNFDCNKVHSQLLKIWVFLKDHSLMPSERNVKSIVYFILFYFRLYQ